MKSSEPQVKVIILAGGRGTRLAPYTTILPKPLMPIDDMPILEVVIRQLKQAGFREIFLAVGHLASLLEAFFGDGSRWGVHIHYSREEKPLGTAGPISMIAGLDSTFLVMNGDLLTNINCADMLRYHREQKAWATVGLYEKSVSVDLGVIESDSNGRIMEYVEKPMLKYEVSAGIYVFEPAVLPYIPKGERYDLPDLIRQLLAAQRPVVGYRFNGYWLDIGRPEDYSQAVDLFERERAAFLSNGQEP